MDGFEQTHGATHAETLACVSSLGELILAMGRLGEAEPLYHRVLAGREETLGETHVPT